MQDSPLNLNRLVVLIGHLMDDHSRARFEAAGQIRRMGPAVVPMILPLGTDPRARMRHMAAYILGRIWIWEPDATGTVVPRRCPDGVPLLVRIKPGTPLLHAAVFVLGGASDEAAAEAGLTTLMVRTAIKGTRRRTALEIADDRL